MQLPQVSIIMATYNRAHLIEETLDAISAQSYKNWECIVIDDGGSDNTQDIVNRYIKNDSRYNYFNRTAVYNKGLPGCRNMGLDKATGEFIIFFDDDDIPHPDNLKICVNKLQSERYNFCRYKRQVFVGKFDYQFDTSTNFSNFEINGRQDILKMIDHRLPFNSCAIMWRYTCFNNIRFQENLMYAEEWECYARILAENTIGISINKTLFYARKHPQSNTGEFYAGNSTRLNSKVDAALMIVDTLKVNALMSDDVAKHFTWLAYRLNAKKLFKKVVRDSTLSRKRKAIEYLRYYCAPAIAQILKVKKRL